MYAQNSPFDMKDHLKARGYRWSDGSDGQPKSWWVEVNEIDYDEELRFLRTDIYRWQDAKPLSVRETDCLRALQAPIELPLTATQSGSGTPKTSIILAASTLQQKHRYGFLCPLE